MLQAMRSGAKSPIMKAFLVFLAGGFALWGVGDITTGLIGGSDKAVSASEESLSPREVALEFERARRNYMPNASTGEALQTGLLSEIVGSLSRAVIFNAENNALGLTVTRAMQRDAVANETNFQDEMGNFSEGRFMQTLASAGISEAEYLGRVDSALKRGQLTQALAAGVVSNKAADTLLTKYELQQRVVKMQSFAVDADNIGTPSDADLDTYFSENKSSYDAPTVRSARVGFISATLIEADVEISEDMVKDAFGTRIDEFSTPETRVVRQMVFENAEKANEALERVDKGEDFNAVAADMLNWTDTDVMLGTVTRDGLDGAIADAVFDASVNVATGPVETLFGQHILIVDDITEGGNATLEDVRDEITSTLRSEEAIDLLYERANLLEDEIASGASLDEALGKVGGKIVTINDIDRNGLDIDGQPIVDDSEIVQESAIIEAIWTNDVGTLSVLQEASADIFFMVDVTTETEARPRSLDEVKQRAIQDWKLVQAIKSARAAADAAIADPASFDNIAASTKFRRNGLGLDHEAARLIANTAFAQANGDFGIVETGTEAIAVMTSEIIEAEQSEIDDTNKMVADIMKNAITEDVISFMAINLSQEHDLQINIEPVRQLLVGSQQ
ncbi:peptidyl-prolyl cis-trans isomerase [Candidatus Puniceispirillum sp.]|uniref:peptidylprolyl isomerase n=1 Tax=Candidatus Puniceispirillum sp. TaxID=2026719 RepID=UPI003F69C201